MSKPYHYVRWRWWNRIDIENVKEELSTMFHVERITMPTSDSEIVISKDERDELKVTADTLIVFLSRMRAVLAQKENVPFTKKDVELRERIMKLYPHSRPSFIPFFLSSEPKFSVEK